MSNIDKLYTKKCCLRDIMIVIIIICYVNYCVDGLHGPYFFFHFELSDHESIGNCYVRKY